MDKKKTILITGAGGQLGQTLALKSQDQSDYNWIFLDKEKLDITVAEKVARIFSETRPDLCIHCAAYTNVNDAEKQFELAYKINVEGLKNIAEACNFHNTTLIHFSTDYVFDGKKAQPYTEKDVPNPLNIYGKTKLDSEKFLLQNNQKAYVIRTSWLYSKTHGKNFYRTILSKLKTGEAIEVVDDQIGSPTSTTQVIDFLVELLAKNPPFGIYHCAGKEILSWFSFALSIANEHQIQPKIKAVKTPPNGISRPKYSALKSIKPF